MIYLFFFFFFFFCFVCFFCIFNLMLWCHLLTKMAASMTAFSWSSKPDNCLLGFHFLVYCFVWVFFFHHSFFLYILLNIAILCPCFLRRIFIIRNHDTCSYWVFKSSRIISFFFQFTVTVLSFLVYIEHWISCLFLQTEYIRPVVVCNILLNSSDAFYITL